MFNAAVFLSLSFLVLVYNANSVGMNPNDMQGENEAVGNYFYDCFILVNCSVDADPNDVEEFGKCVSWAKLPDDIHKFLRKYTKEDIYKFESPELGGMSSELCSLEDDKREAVYDEGKKIYLDIYSESCVALADEDECNHWNDIAGCVVELYQKMHDEGKC